MTHKRTAMVLSKPLKPDVRVAKEARSLSRSGFEVQVFCWDRLALYSKFEHDNGFEIRRVHIPSSYQNFAKFIITAPLFWGWAVAQVIANNPSIVHCHDFDTMPVGLVAKFFGKRLVYDAHEYYPEMVRGTIPEAIRRLLAKIDLLFAQAADLVILPTRERRHLYPSADEVFLVLNSPSAADSPLCEVRNSEFTLFYAGGLSKENGIETIVSAVQQIRGVRLVLAGEGPLSDWLREVERRDSRITYLGSIGHRQVLEWIARSHAVPALYEPVNLNSRYTASNKIYEAMMMATPVITNEENTQSRIVCIHRCGLTVRYGDTDALVCAIQTLLTKTQLVEELGTNGRAAFMSYYNWELGEAGFVERYGRLLKDL